MPNVSKSLRVTSVPEFRSSIGEAKQSRNTESLEKVKLLDSVVMATLAEAISEQSCFTSTQRFNMTNPKTQVKVKFQGEEVLLGSNYFPLYSETFQNVIIAEGLICFQEGKGLDETKVKAQQLFLTTLEEYNVENYVTLVSEDEERVEHLDVEGRYSALNFLQNFRSEALKNMVRDVIKVSPKEFNPEFELEGLTIFEATLTLQDRPPRKIRHICYTNWPENVSIDHETFYKLCQIIRHFQNDAKNKTLYVSCRSGLGRSRALMQGFEALCIYEGSRNKLSLKFSEIFSKLDQYYTMQIIGEDISEKEREAKKWEWLAKEFVEEGLITQTEGKDKVKELKQKLYSQRPCYSRQSSTSSLTTTDTMDEDTTEQQDISRPRSRSISCKRPVDSTAISDSTCKNEEIVVNRRRSLF